MAKQNGVNIVPDEMGNQIRVSKNNPEYGHVVLSQEDTAFTQTGWIKKVTKTTLLHGTIDDLKNEKQLKNKTLPGSIYVIEQLKPFSEENPNYDLKIAGNTGIVCKGVDVETGETDLPIYRKSYYDPTGTMNDKLVLHTNSQEIRAANSSEVVTNLKNNIKEPITSTNNQLDLEDVIEDIENEMDETDLEENLVEEEEISFNL